MSYIRIILSLLLVHTLSLCAIAQYEISGTINLSPEWQPQIFLANINKLDNYYKASPEDIINVGNINPDGSFRISGDNLPLDPQYYRLYLVKEENSEFDACLYVGGDDHNFIHLILDNQSKIHLTADPNHFAPFGNYNLRAGPSNLLLQELSVLIFPSFYFYQIKFPSELQFSEEKLNRDLFQFADTCQNIMVALAAITNTDMDKYFDLEKHQYEIFSKRLLQELPKHNYTHDYLRKMRYYGEEKTSVKTPSWFWFILIGLSLSLLAALYKINSLQQKLDLVSDKSLNVKATNFTSQEKRILSLIAEEKTNKQIASNLYIEVSTVKTHINKLYSKLGAKNREEAKSLAQSILFKED